MCVCSDQDRLWSSHCTGVGLSGVQWNPGSPELLAVVLSSGSLHVLEVKEDVRVVATEADMGAASCEC